MICYDQGAKYKIQCGSSVPHCICNTCEKTLRLKAKPGKQGRMVTCPFCRKEEKEAGLRSRTSYEAELKMLYAQLYKQQQRDQANGWCKNREHGCQMRSRTTRMCTYPGGCLEYVCRNCTMCMGHFAGAETQAAILAE